MNISRFIALEARPGSNRYGVQVQLKTDLFDYDKPVRRFTLKLLASDYGNTDLQQVVAVIAGIGILATEVRLG